MESWKFLDQKILMFEEEHIKNEVFLAVKKQRRSLKTEIFEKMKRFIINRFINNLWTFSQNFSEKYLILVKKFVYKQNCVILRDFDEEEILIATV